MTTITIGVPVLNRPANAASTAESAAASAANIRLHLLFIVSPGDEEELAAVRETGADYLVVPWEAGPGDFARKHNYAIRKTSERFYFVGADDLLFHPGWAEHALAVQQETQACVIGTNDLGNPTVKAGQHATHMLVHRGYLKCNPVADAPGQLFCELYDHACCDNELVETARARGTFAFAAASRVEHLHPFWGKAVTDATYEKGLARSAQDRALLNSRRRLWA